VGRPLSLSLARSIDGQIDQSMDRWIEYQRGRQMRVDEIDHRGTDLFQTGGVSLFFCSRVAGAEGVSALGSRNGLPLCTPCARLLLPPVSLEVARLLCVQEAPLAPGDRSCAPPRLPGLRCDRKSGRFKAPCSMGSRVLACLAASLLLSLPYIGAPLDAPWVSQQRHSFPASSPQ